MSKSAGKSDSNSVNTSKGFSKNFSITQAIVLCAGRGKRLKPHTDTTPKPLLPVSGKPTLDFVFDSLSQAGIERVVLVTHYLGEQIEAYAQQQSFFPTDAIHCVDQKKLSGTADATLIALKAKPAWFKNSFLLTASDYLVPQDFYSDLLQAHQQSGQAIACSLKRIAESEMNMRSSVRFNAKDDVLEVVEKPAPGTAPSALSANLVYVLPADIRRYIEEVEFSERGEKEIQTAINQYLQLNGPACGLEQATPIEWHEQL